MTKKCLWSLERMKRLTTSTMTEPVIHGKDRMGGGSRETNYYIRIHAKILFQGIWVLYDPPISQLNNTPKQLLLS